MTPPERSATPCKVPACAGPEDCGNTCCRWISHLIRRTEYESISCTDPGGERRRIGLYTRVEPGGGEHAGGHRADDTSATAGRSWRDRGAVLHLGIAELQLGRD